MNISFASKRAFHESNPPAKDALTRVCILLQVSLLDVGTLGSEVVFSFWLHSTLMGNDYSAGEMYLPLSLPTSPLSVISHMLLQDGFIAAL